MLRQIRKDSRGFTLIEVMVALTIFAIGLLSVAKMQITTLRTNAVSDSLATSADLAQGVMEELLSWSPDRAEMQVDSTNVVWDFDRDTLGVQPGLTINAAGELVPTADAGVYGATYSVTVDYNAITDLNRIVVTVTANNGRHRPVTLVSYKSRGIEWRGNL